MRVLYLCHRIPYPPDKGDKIRAFHQLRAIGARYRVDLFTLADDAADLQHQAPLAECCSRVTVARLNSRLARLRSLPFLATDRPLTLPYFYSAELAAEVRRALARRSYDRIFVYCSAMAQYVEGIGDIPILTDLVDVDSDKWMQYAASTRLPFRAIYRREGKALRRYERRVCDASSSVVVTTEREARLAREIAPAAQVHVIPNGVDTEFFKPASIPGKAPVIGFTGDMSYFPNQEAVVYFARQVFPLVRRSLPDVQFLIVGRNPNREVERLRAIEGVEVTGFVRDVREYLARMRVSVAPFSIAAGIQNKILEAMACEIPVVATSRTAQGLAPEAAAVVEIADSAEEMAAKVLALLQDPRRAREKGREGRRRVMAAYNWSRSLDDLLELLENPVKPGAAHTGALPIS